MYRTLSDEERKFTCLVLHLSNGKDLYLTKLRDWLTIPDYCKENDLSILSISLQYRSNLVDIDTSDVDGLYIVQTAKGIIGDEVQHFVTIGKLYGDVVKKTLYSTPALIVNDEFEDNIDTCIEEALFVYEKKA